MTLFKLSRPFGCCLVGFLLTVVVSQSFAQDPVVPTTPLDPEDTAAPAIPSDTETSLSPENPTVTLP